jgi:hypothetical protein
LIRTLRLTFITIIANILAINTYCQNYPLDGPGLKAALRSASADTAKIRLLDELRRYYAGQYRISQKYANLDSAITSIKAAVHLSEVIKNDSLKFRSIRYLGITYLLTKDSVQAKKFQLQAVTYYLANGYYTLAIKSWIGFGENSDRNGMNSLGMQAYKNSAKLLSKHPAAGDEIIVRYHIAQEFALMGDSYGAEKKLFRLLQNSKTNSETWIK